MHLFLILVSCMLRYLSTFFRSRMSPKAEGVIMKKDIHPKVYEVEVTCVSCGSKFKTHSTNKEIRVDTCSNCHPFYTGKQRFVSSDGRVDRFNKKYGLK